MYLLPNCALLTRQLCVSPWRSHDNLTWTSRLTAELIFPGEEEEHIISFLPLSHIAAQMIDIHLPITRGVTVWFAQPDALKVRH